MGATEIVSTFLAITLVWVGFMGYQQYRLFNVKTYLYLYTIHIHDLKAPFVGT